MIEILHRAFFFDKCHLETHVANMATCVSLSCFYKTDMIGYKHKEAGTSEDYDKCG